MNIEKKLFFYKGLGKVDLHDLRLLIEEKEYNNMMYKTKGLGYQYKGEYIEVYCNEIHIIPTDSGCVHIAAQELEKVLSEYQYFDVIYDCDKSGELVFSSFQKQSGKYNRRQRRMLKKSKPLRPKRPTIFKRK